MSKPALRSFLYRLYCLLLAVHVLNFSVDPPDTHVRRMRFGVVREDLSVNEMESIGEWVLEHILGLPNAVPEHDEADVIGKIVKAFFCWIAPGAPSMVLLPTSTDVVDPIRFAFHQLFAPSCVAEVVSPPPRPA